MTKQARSPHTAALQRALGHAEQISQSAAALGLELAQARVDIGLIPELLGAVSAQLAAQLRQRIARELPSSEAPGRNVRYLNAAEHQFLERAARAPDGIMTYYPTLGMGSAPERMDAFGLLFLLPNEGNKRRAKITAPGRVALRTWRYEVPAG